MKPTRTYIPRFDKPTKTLYGLGFVAILFNLLVEGLK